MASTSILAVQMAAFTSGPLTAALFKYLIGQGPSLCLSTHPDLNLRRRMEHDENYACVTSAGIHRYVLVHDEFDIADKFSCVGTHSNERGLVG